MKLSPHLLTNQKAWDAVSQDFHVPGSSLPYWGPYRVGQHDSLIGSIKGKTFLEIGCGCGLSIKYLMERGAKNIYGLDLSSDQIKIAEVENQLWIEKQKVELFQSPMEEKVSLPELVDTVYSIYAIGWTTNAKTTLKNIASYLKKGGRFVWSWEHPDFNGTEYQEGKVSFHDSYFDKEPYFVENWKGSNGIYLYPRTLSFWFDELRKAGFRVTEFLEPEPTYFNEKQKTQEDGYYFYKKAETIPATMIFVCEKE